MVHFAGMKADLGVYPEAVSVFVFSLPLLILRPLCFLCFSVEGEYPVVCSCICAVSLLLIVSEVQRCGIHKNIVFARASSVEGMHPVAIALCLPSPDRKGLRWNERKAFPKGC
jgi:hypothetical protein